jgi:hypothetical protein
MGNVFVSEAAEQQNNRLNSQPTYAPSSHYNYNYQKTDKYLRKIMLTTLHLIGCTNTLHKNTELVHKTKNYQA